MILFINTAEKEKITVGLIKTHFLFDRITEKNQWQESEKLLPLINQLLKRNKIKLNRLTGIIVVSGPGGFTSLRIGIITANILSYSLKIPVVGIKLDKGKLEQGIRQIKKIKTFKIVEPFYGQPPNITKPKKR